MDDSSDTNTSDETTGASSDDQVQDWWNYCPNCGHELQNVSCKYRCPNCHYFMSCSDFD